MLSQVFPPDKICHKIAKSPKCAIGDRMICLINFLHNKMLLHISITGPKVCYLHI